MTLSYRCANIPCRCFPASVGKTVLDDMRPILIYAANHVLKCLPPRELASKDPNADLTHDRYDDSELLCEIDYNGIMAN
jgi:hypothetical protein